MGGYVNLAVWILAACIPSNDCYCCFPLVVSQCGLFEVPRYTARRHMFLCYRFSLYKYVFIIIIIISSNEVSSTGKALYVHACNHRESYLLLSRPAPSLAVWLSLFSAGRVFAGFRPGRLH